MARLLLLLASTFLAACAHTAIDEARQDATLIDEIARASMAEIAAGNLAVINGQSPALRQFGERMVDEHSSLLRAASGLAASHGTAIPATPGGRHQPVLKQLQSLPAAAFDRAFLEQSVKRQEETLQLLQQAAARAADPRLRGYAQQAVPLLERDLAAALRMAEARTSARSQ
jgi:putative membrane protein